MPRARKLFPVYGSALANKMLSAIAREGVVSRFVAGYVTENDRRGILGGPARERELVETMGREILLALIVEVGEILPGFFGKKPRNKLRSEEKEAMDAFTREMLEALRSRAKLESRRSQAVSSRSRAVFGIQRAAGEEGEGA